MAFKIQLIGKATSFSLSLSYNSLALLLRARLFKCAFWASPVAQTVKNLPAMQKTQVWSLGREDPKKVTATHSSILAKRIPWTEEPGVLQSMGSQRVRHAWASEYVQTHPQEARINHLTTPLCSKSCTDPENLKEESRTLDVGIWFPILRSLSTFLVTWGKSLPLFLKGRLSDEIISKINS